MALKPSIWSGCRSTKKNEGATSGISRAIEPRSVPSICPTAASTARPSPSDRTTAEASARRVLTAPSASRSAGRVRASGISARASGAASCADSASRPSAPAMPPSVHSVSLQLPENRQAAATSARAAAPIIAR